MMGDPGLNGSINAVVLFHFCPAFYLNQGIPMKNIHPNPDSAMGKGCLKQRGTRLQKGLGVSKGLIRIQGINLNASRKQTPCCHSHGLAIGNDLFVRLVMGFLRFMRLQPKSLGALEVRHNVRFGEGCRHGVNIYKKRIIFTPYAALWNYRRRV